MNFSINRFRISYPVILAILLFVINIIFLSLPLIGIIGYENSAANSFILFILGGLLIVYFLRKHAETPPDYFFFLIKEWKMLLLLMLIPFIVAIIPSVFFSNCPLSDGIEFYLVLVIPGLFLGTSAGFFSYSVSKKFGYVLLIICVLVLISISVLEFYFNPQVYFFNPLIGFTPGTIYDEELSVNLSLLIYRGLNILAGIGLIVISMFLYRFKNYSKTLLVVIVLLSLTVFYYIKPSMGYSTDTKRLVINLDNSVQTKHFNIHYAQPDNYFSTPQLIALLHEYYLERAEEGLNVNIKYKIRSYLFKNSTQKKELFGAGNADVAKPWQRQVFLNYNSYGISLKHELIHVLAGEFGKTPFKVADGINNAMIEGFAVAVDDDFDGYPVHYAVKLAREAGYKVNINNLFSGFNFFSQYASLSYIYAGSFIRFLIDKYGISKIESLYRNLDFPKVLGRNLNQLGNEYYSFIDSIKIDFNKYKAQLYFAGQPIFKKYCPRTAASQIKEASKLYSQKKFSEALKIYSKVFEYSNSYQSLTGKVNSLIKLESIQNAETFLSGKINQFKKSRYFFNLELMLADVYIRSNKITEAENLYDSLLVQSPHINYTNNVLTKMELLKNGADSLKKYLDADSDVKFNMLENLNKDTICYFSVSELLNLCSDTTQLREVCVLFENAKAEDFISSYALLKLSQASVYLYDYNTARNFAVESLKYMDDKYFLHEQSDNLRKINWLINYSDELKPYFVYR